MTRYRTASASYRTATEDRAHVWPLPGGGLVIAVADGAGGIGGGDRAAEMVIDGVEAGASSSSVEVDWCQLLRALDVEIETDRNAGESTAVIVEIATDGSIEGASCGDSMAWIVSGDRMLDDLTADQHRKRRLGSGRALPVPFLRAKAKGWLVVASDGLSGVVTNERLVAGLLGDHEDSAEALVEAAKTPRGTWADDVVVAVVRLG